MAKKYIYDILPPNAQACLIVLPQYPNTKIPATYRNTQIQFEIDSNGYKINVKDVLYWEEII